MLVAGLPLQKLLTAAAAQTAVANVVLMRSGQHMCKGGIVTNENPCLLAHKRTSLARCASTLAGQREQQDVMMQAA
jgi:hypothetical protein